MWKCRTVENEENQNQASLVFHRPWKSLRDSHIPTTPTTILPFPNQNQKTRKEPQLRRKPQPPSLGSSFDEKMQTLPAAGAAVGEQIATPTAEGEFVVNADGVEEVVADKGYHSGEVLAEMQAMEVRTYIAEPERGRRQWTGKEEQKAAVYRNRRRVTGQRGKALLRKRGEMLERPFAHLYETGRMRRLYVRGKINVQKKLLLQAAACNLALVLRQLLGAGTPRGLQDRIAELFLLVLWITAARMAHPEAPTTLSWRDGRIHGLLSTCAA